MSGSTFFFFLEEYKMNQKKFNIDFVIYNKFAANVRIAGDIDVEAFGHEYDSAYLTFYDSLNQITERIPANPFTDGSTEHDLFEKMKYEFQTDSLLEQRIYDFLCSTEEYETLEVPYGKFVFEKYEVEV